MCMSACVPAVQVYVCVFRQARQQFSGNSLVFLVLFIQALLKRTKQWNIGRCQEKSALVPNSVWASPSCKVSNLQSSHYLPRVTVRLLWITKVWKFSFVRRIFFRCNPGNPCVMSSLSVQWFPVNPLLAPLLMVHSLCPQQMWHAVSTVPSKLAAEPSPAWKTQLVTQMACMTSASPSYTVLLNLTLRYTLKLIPQTLHTYIQFLSVFCVHVSRVGLHGCNSQGKNVWITAVFFFVFFYRVKRLWRRALSALPMASPPRHSPPSAAAPPSKEWYLKSKKSATASWISALWPDRIQMLLVKWHSYQVTSRIGELNRFYKYSENSMMEVIHGMSAQNVKLCDGQQKLNLKTGFLSPFKVR